MDDSTQMVLVQRALAILATTFPASRGKNVPAELFWPIGDPFLPPVGQSEWQRSGSRRYLADCEGTDFRFMRPQGGKKTPEMVAGATKGALLPGGRAHWGGKKAKRKSLGPEPTYL